MPRSRVSVAARELLLPLTEVLEPIRDTSSEGLFAKIRRKCCWLFGMIQPCPQDWTISSHRDIFCSSLWAESRNQRGF